MDKKIVELVVGYYTNDVTGLEYKNGVYYLMINETSMNIIDVSFRYKLPADNLVIEVGIRKKDKMSGIDLWYYDKDLEVCNLIAEDYLRDSEKIIVEQYIKGITSTPADFDKKLDEIELDYQLKKNKELNAEIEKLQEQYNTLKAEYDTLKSKQGRPHKDGKTTEERIDEYIKYYDTGLTRNEICAKMNISNATLQRLRAAAKSQGKL